VNLKQAKDYLKGNKKILKYFVLKDKMLNAYATDSFDSKYDDFIVAVNNLSLTEQELSIVTDIEFSIGGFTSLMLKRLV
jgi:hypothetical protein